MQSLGNALKYLRRHVHLHTHNWKALVVCKSKGQYDLAYDEIYRTLDAGSLPIENANKAQGWIQLSKGAMVRFAVLKERQQQQTLEGMEFTQVLWMFEPDDQVIRNLVRSRIRSATVPEDQLVDEKIDW